MGVTKKIGKYEFVAMVQDYQKRNCIDGRWQRGKWSNEICEIIFDNMDATNEEFNSFEELVGQYNTTTVEEFEQYYTFEVEREFANSFDNTGEVTLKSFQNQLDGEFEDEDDWPMVDLAVSFVGVERFNKWEHNSPLDQTLVFHAL